MLRLFQVKRKVYGQTKQRDAVANWIGSVVRKVQPKFASCLSKKTAALTSNQLTLIVLVFCLSWFIVTAYYISRSFTQNRNDRLIYITHLRQLPPANSRMRLPIDPSTVVTEKEYQHILRFEEYADSLKIHDRHVYDSMLCGRPALMDSLVFLKVLYHQQKNIKHE